MRWWTFPLRCDDDAEPATRLVRAWAETLATDAAVRRRALSILIAAIRSAIGVGDGLLDFGWDDATERPTCEVELPAACSAPELAPSDATTFASVRVVEERLRVKVSPSTRVPRDVVRAALSAVGPPRATGILRAQHGSIAAALSAARDRGDRLEQSISALEARLEAFEIEAAGAAHDIRSPVAAAKTALELLEPSLAAMSDEQRHLIGVARRATETVAQLSGNLLAIADLEVDSEPRVDSSSDVAAVAREVLFEQAVRARSKEIVLGFEVSVEPLRARVGAEDARQIVTALVDNGLRFAPRGGHVLVALSREERVVCLAVEDDGEGIPADQAERVFEKHAKLRPRGTAGERGSGLGLFVVRRLAERVGGSARAAVGPGGGARLEVRLPCEG